MLPVDTSKKHKDLLNEIAFTLRHWPELERRVFIMTHYRGQSRENIASVLELDVEEIDKILKRCDRKLHTALRSFRIGNRARHSHLSLKINCLAACG